MRRWNGEVEALAPRVLELSEFLVDRLGLDDVGAAYPHRVTYHPTCHSLRVLRVGDAPKSDCSELFAGSISSIFPRAPSAAASVAPSRSRTPRRLRRSSRDKVRSVLDTGAEVCTALDNSCLLQIGGALSRLRTGVRATHLAEILAAEAA